MNGPHSVLRLPLEEDLLPLAALLRSRGVPHRIYEEAGSQVLEVYRREHVQPVAELYRAWRAGEVRIQAQPGPAVASAGRGRARRWQGAPVTASFALLSVAVFLALLLGAPDQWLGWLSFNPMDSSGGQLHFRPMGGELWRLVTPIFLHFGWLHITFNTLWLWELGAGAERAIGSGRALALLLVIAAVANVSQYLASGPVLFGGMSGVVYGLLGFAWVAPQIQPRWQIQPPKPVLVFMLGWLFACLFGVVEFLGFGAIANAAHFGGLLCGAVLGALLAGLDRVLGGSG